MSVDVKIPEVGESISEGTIVSWLVAVGDAVSVDQPLLELETDKVTAEVPSPIGGVVTELLFDEGADVQIGAVVARIDETQAGAVAAPEAAPEAAPAAAGSSAMPPLPAARRAAAEAGVDPADVAGTGVRGQVRKEDVQRHVAAPAAPAAPVAPPVEPGAGARGVRRVKMTRMRRAIATHLKNTQNTAAMLTTFNEVDMSAVMALRSEYKDAFLKRHGVKLGFMSFFLKAAVEALKEFPAVNGYVDGDEVVYHEYFDVGIAVSSDRGLVVPVVRDADRLSFAEVEKTIGNLAGLARDGGLTLSQLQGGTFTVTNGGTFGSMLSTPILNGTNQSGILGMHNIVRRPVAVGDNVEIRPIMYVALSYDHRIVDGSEAVRFLYTIKSLIEEPARLLLEV